MSLTDPSLLPCGALPVLAAKGECIHLLLIRIVDGACSVFRIYEYHACFRYCHFMLYTVSIFGYNIVQL